MTSPKLSRLSRKQPRVAFWAAALLLVYALVGFLVLPPIIRSVAVKQLSKQLDREVSIETVRLNPFVLSVSIRGLLIKDKDGQPFASWDQVYVNLQLSSFFGHAWVFKEISTTRPFVRVQINKDYSLNFSDLITKFSTNSTPPKPSKSLALRIDRLHIAGATASLMDSTTRTPFRRILGPLNVTLEHFRTDPDSRNPYSFAGTTDAGEKFSWSGYFSLDPIRSEGSVSLENLSLNKYAPLYQDFVRFEIQSGLVSAEAAYHFELSPSNRVVSVTNAAFALRSFALVEPGVSNPIVSLPEFAVSGASVDLSGRRAEISTVSATGARLRVRRDKSEAINVVTLSKPAEGATNAPFEILLLLRSVTNAVALLLNSTNAWTATLHDVAVSGCALELADDANPRPVRLTVDQISLTARNLSNLPGTNLTASLSVRWNTNGSVKAEVSASLLPPSADIQFAVNDLELRPLDPYLEPRLNLLITRSKLGLEGAIRLRTPAGGLPEVTFHGGARLDDLSIVDGVLGEDLLKWGSVRVSDIDANLNPPRVGIRQIDVDDAYARLIIETNRSINLRTALGETAGTDSALPPPAPAKTDSAAAGTGPVSTTTNVPAAPALPDISIATVVISNAQVRFTDRSLVPNVHLSIQQAGGTISGLSTKELEHADIVLHAKVDNIGPVEISGVLNPFNEHLTNEIKVVVRDVDLTPTSPYSGKFAGYRIAKGKLNLTLAYHLQGRNLRSENLITLDQFTFGEKVNSADATKLPVRLAVAVLKDRDGKIEIDVPIEGSLDDPQFKLNKVILHALMNVLTKIVTSPFSVLGSLFGGHGEEIRYQDFAPGSAELLPAGIDKLNGLVKGLYERPGLQLEIQGSIDPELDRDALRRLALDKQVRVEKWLSLRKSAREETSPDRIQVTAEERADLIRKLYAEALSKGRIAAPTTNPPAKAATAAQPSAARGAAAIQPQLQPDSGKKGATSLLRASIEPATPPRVHAGSSQPVIGAGADEIERPLLDSMVVGDTDFEALASERAKSVRAYVVSTGKVEAERVFLAENPSSGVKTEGARAYLQLR